MKKPGDVNSKKLLLETTLEKIFETTLVFMGYAALPQNFNFCFWPVYCYYWQIYKVLRFY